MIHWMAFNFLVLLTCIFVLVEDWLGIDIGILNLLAWILLIVAVILIIKDASTLFG